MTITSIGSGVRLFGGSRLSSKIIRRIEIKLATWRISCSSMVARQLGSGVDGNASFRWVLISATMSAASLRCVNISSNLSDSSSEGSRPCRRKWRAWPLSLTCGMANLQWLKMASGSSTSSAFSVWKSWKSVLFNW